MDRTVLLSLPQHLRRSMLMEYNLFTTTVSRDLKFPNFHIYTSDFFPENTKKTIIFFPLITLGEAI